MVWRVVVLDRGAIYRHGPERLVGAGQVPICFYLLRGKGSKIMSRTMGQGGVEAGEDYEDHGAESPKAARGLDQQGRL